MSWAWRNQSAGCCPGGIRIYETYSDMPPEQIGRMEELAFECGQYSESYLITEPNRSYLWSACGNGVVGFVRSGKHLLVVGGLITRDENKKAFVQDIAGFCRANNMRIHFFHVDDRDVGFFEAAGFQVTKFGVEARIQLSGHNWSGKAYEWVRRQVNFATRHGLVCEEWSADLCSAEDWQQRLTELQEVSKEHIGAKHFRGEIPFFEGQLLDEHLLRRRCFVARSDQGLGRVEGFLLCTPFENGSQWAMEMYRHRVDSVRGVIPFLMHQTIEAFKGEGCHGVSMCPVPAIGCEERRPGDSLLVRTVMMIWNKMGAAVFDTKGLYHYKSRFRPDFRDIFVCSSSKATFGSMWAYLKVTRTLDLKVGTFLRDAVRLLNPQRRTLAKPVIAPQYSDARQMPVVAGSSVRSESKAA